MQPVTSKQVFVILTSLIYMMLAISNGLFGDRDPDPSKQVLSLSKQFKKNFSDKKRCQQCEYYALGKISVRSVERDAPSILADLSSEGSARPFPTVAFVGPKVVHRYLSAQTKVVPVYLLARSIRI